MHPIFLLVIWLTYGKCLNTTMVVHTTRFNPIIKRRYIEDNSDLFLTCSKLLTRTQLKHKVRGLIASLSAFPLLRCIYMQ